MILKFAKKIILSLSITPIVLSFASLSCCGEPTLKTCTLDVNVEGEGQIRINHFENLENGTTLKSLEGKINPQAYTGWKFDGYYDDKGKIQDIKTYKIVRDTTILVKFIERPKFTVSLSIEGEGKIAQTSIASVIEGTHLSDLHDQIKPEAEGEWGFNGYKHDGIKIDTPEKFEIKSNIDITVIFEKVFEFEFDDVEKTAKLKKFNGAESNVVIPSHVQHDDNTYTVKTIGEQAFFHLRTVKTVFIPATVVTLEDETFVLPYLESVTFEENSQLVTIGSMVFMACTDLKVITIPPSVTSIGDHTFELCLSLTSIVIPKNVESIGYQTFHNCQALSSLEIEEGSQLTTIGSHAFEGCKKLTSITIPPNVTTLGEYLIKDCIRLKTIDLSGVTFSEVPLTWQKVTLETTRGTIYINNASQEQMWKSWFGYEQLEEKGWTIEVKP